MYKFLFSILLFFVTTNTFSQVYSTQNLIGNWEGTDTKNSTGKLTFTDSANIIVYVPAQGTFNAKYTIDASTSPMLFDIIISGEASSVTVKGLLKFLDSNTIKWQTFFGKERPNDFIDSRSDDIIVLTRKN